LERGQAERSPIFSGLRGVGKTVLLGECDVILREFGWATSGVVEIREGTDSRGALVALARELLEQLSAMEAVRGRIRRALAGLRNLTLVVKPDQVEIGVGRDPAGGLAASGDLEQDFADLMEEVGTQVRDANTGAALVIDEMQNLPDEALEAIVTACHRLSQQNLPVAVIAAGLPHLPVSLSQAKTYAERLFAFRAVDRLSAEAAREALSLPAETLGVSYASKALDLLVATSDGYPYFLQEFGREAWDTAPYSPITREDAERACGLATDRLDQGFFRVRYERASDSERRYMAAMATVGNGACSVSEVNDAVSAAGGRGPANARASLLRKGLIYAPRHGYVEFTVPRFDDFLRRVHPLN
jgi:hypothetical protein